MVGLKAQQDANFTAEGAFRRLPLWPHDAEATSCHFGTMTG
jgi:hypothetical protein